MECSIFMTQGYAYFFPFYIQFLTDLIQGKQTTNFAVDGFRSFVAETVLSAAGKYPFIIKVLIPEHKCKWHPSTFNSPVHYAFISIKISIYNVVKGHHTLQNDQWYQLSMLWKNTCTLIALLKGHLGCTQMQSKLCHCGITESVLDLFSIYFINIQILMKFSLGLWQLKFLRGPTWDLSFSSFTLLTSILHITLKSQLGWRPFIHLYIKCLVACIFSVC